MLAAARQRREGVYGVHTGGHLAKDRVGVGQAHAPKADEELRAVGVGTGVGHRQRALAVLPAPLEFVGEAVAGPAAPRAGGIARLHDESGDDPVNRAVGVVTRPGEEDEVVDGYRGALGLEIQFDRSATRVESGGVAEPGVESHGRGFWPLHGATLSGQGLRPVGGADPERAGGRVHEAGPPSLAT